MGFCKIVKVEKSVFVSGNVYWVLTHACGKIERRIKYRPGSRYERPAPSKVKCDASATESNS